MKSEFGASPRQWEKWALESIFNGKKKSWFVEKWALGNLWENGGNVAWDEECGEGTLSPSVDPTISWEW